MYDGVMCDAVIFDFNGVLLWDTSLHEEAWQMFAHRLRGRAWTEEEMARYLHGRHNRDILAHLLDRPVDLQEAERLGEEKEEIYRALCLALGVGFVLSPGAESLLDFLAAQRVPRAIATSSGLGNIDFYDTHLHLARWFDPSLVVWDDGQRRGKPAPDIYLEAAGRLGLPPARCLVVEDSRSGIEAARAAGIGCVVGLGAAPLPGTALTIPSLAHFPRALVRQSQA